MAIEQMNNTSEIELVLAAQRGDRAAFGELVVRYHRAVESRVLRHMDNHAEVQEACQDVFIKAWRKLRQLRHPECFGGWLRSIAARTALNRVMRRRPMIATEPETMAAVYVDVETPLAAALADERASQVRAGLRRLTKIDRQTLLEFYFQGRSLVEMSERFASPVGTIKRRLHVARKRLAKELAECVA